MDTSHTTIRASEILMDAVQETLLHFCGLCLQETHQALTVKMRERARHGSGRERGRVATVKYVQTLLHNKGFLSREKDFTRISTPTVEQHRPHCRSLWLSCLI